MTLPDDGDGRTAPWSRVSIGSNLRGSQCASNVHEPFCADCAVEGLEWGFYMDRHLIEGFEACGPKLRQAVAGLSPEELTARPGPGDWSILELVIHLADSDSIAIDRMKRMLIEDNPPLLYADETAYVRLLASHEQSLEDSRLDAVRARPSPVRPRVPRLLPDEAFDRLGTHNRRGILTVGGSVKDYIDHVDHHLAFLLEKRARLDKLRPQPPQPAPHAQCKGEVP